MARYKIYDNKSDVITPVGEKLTAEQWLDRYQWGRYTKMIVGGGIINGSVALVFDDEVERYRKAGCDFSACVTDEDYLVAIEAFEDDPPMADAGVSDQTRIADALEDMVALSLPESDGRCTYRQPVLPCRCNSKPFYFPPLHAAVVQTPSLCRSLRKTPFLQGHSDILPESAPTLLLLS